MNSVEKHPQRQQIIDAILAGESLRNIAATADPPLHFSTISRFRLRVLGNVAQRVHGRSEFTRHIKDVADIAAPQGDIDQAKERLREDLQRSVARLEAKADGWIQNAEEPDDEGQLRHRALSSHHRNLLQSIELRAKLSGVLQDVAPQLQIVASMQIGSDGQVAGEVIDIAETR